MLSPQSASYLLNLASIRAAEITMGLHDASKQSDTRQIREWKAEQVVCGKAISELEAMEVAR